MNKKVFIIALIVLIIDQLTKALANVYLTQNSILLIPDFFRLTYALNTGAAWSILNNHQILLVVISIALLVIILIFQKKFKENNRNNIAFGLLFGGIVGNLIDRLFHGYVIDFFDFKIFNYDFPIFNIADIGVVVGIILLVIAIIKGEDDENNSRGK